MVTVFVYKIFEASGQIIIIASLKHSGNFPLLEQPVDKIYGYTEFGNLLPTLYRKCRNIR